MVGLVRSAAYWRLRAQELRGIAEAMTDPRTKATFAQIAGDYETMARQTAAQERIHRLAGDDRDG